MLKDLQGMLPVSLHKAKLSRKVALEGMSLNVLNFPYISSDWSVGGESLPRLDGSANGFASYRLHRFGPRKEVPRGMEGTPRREIEKVYKK